MALFDGILTAVIFGDGAFGILNTFDGEQFPKKARGTDLGSDCGIGAGAKILGPLIIRATIDGSAAQQEVTLQAVFPAFILLVALLFVGGILHLFAKEARGTSLKRI